MENRLHEADRMHEMQTIAINDPVAWVSVDQSVSLSVRVSRERLFILTYQMAPLRCSHYHATLVVTFYFSRPTCGTSPYCFYMRFRVRRSAVRGQHAASE